MSVSRSSSRARRMRTSRAYARNVVPPISANARWSWRRDVASERATVSRSSELDGSRSIISTASSYRARLLSTVASRTTPSRPTLSLRGAQHRPSGARGLQVVSLSGRARRFPSQGHGREQPRSAPNATPYWHIAHNFFDRNDGTRIPGLAANSCHPGRIRTDVRGRVAGGAEVRGDGVGEHHGEGAVVADCAGGWVVGEGSAAAFAARGGGRSVCWFARGSTRRAV